MANKKNSVNNNAKNNENKNNVNNTKNNVNKCFIDAANDMLANVSKDLRKANKEHFSISHVLKDMQRNDELKNGYGNVFKALNWDINKKLDAKTFFSLLDDSQYYMDKKGNKCYGIWGYKYEKDNNGNVISTTKVLRKVTSWSPNKVFKMMAQSIAIKTENTKNTKK